MTESQIKTAMLALLNDRVGVRGTEGAMRFLGDLLGISAEEATATVDDFTYKGVHFVKKLHIEKGRMSRKWEAVA